MITQEPTEAILEEWKSVWLRYKDKLNPNRKSGTDLLNYLLQKYILTEMHEKGAADAVIGNVTMNTCYAEKLPVGMIPVPRTFFLENAGNGDIFYRAENKDSEDIWGADITRIFVGIDTVTGFFMVEGSTMLYDELIAFQGLDEKDIKNFVCVSQYIAALKQFDRLQDVVSE